MTGRQDIMTGMERVEALFKYNKLDRVPIAMTTVGFPNKNVGTSITDAYGDPEKSFQAITWTSDQYCWDPCPQIFRHTVTAATDFGGKVRLPQGEYDGALIIEQYPIDSEEEVERLELPDPKTAGAIEVAMRFAKLQQAHGYPVSFISRSPLSMAGNICGLEKFCRWMMKKPDLCFHLMKLSLDHIFNVLDYWIETFGADNLFVYMSSPSESNQVISPKMFEKFAIPYHDKYHAGLRARGIKKFCIHICGEQNRNLPYFKDLSCWPHPSVLSFGHEVDLDVAAATFPEDIICGNVEPAVIQIGTPQEVYELSRIAIEKGRKAPGGFVLSAGCELPPNAPAGNVYAMTKAVEDFGWYS